MIYEVEISTQADLDLRMIYEYIAFALKSPMNAFNQLDRLEKNIMDLRQMPERFHRYEKEPWYSRGLRVMYVDNYCVFYITNSKNIVSILRILYGGRNIDKQLQDIT